jgi:hypothetical protein
MQRKKAGNCFKAVVFIVRCCGLFALLWEIQGKNGIIIDVGSNGRN